MKAPSLLGFVLAAARSTPHRTVTRVIDRITHDERARPFGARSRLARSAFTVAAVVLLGCASTPPAVSTGGAPASQPRSPAPAASPTIAAEPLAGPFRSVADFCRSSAALARGKTCGDLTESVEGPKTLTQPEAPFREARLFQIGESAYWHSVVLGIRTDRGWFFPTPENQPDLALDQQLDGPHRIHVEPKRIGIERGALPVLVFRYLESAYDSANATDDGSSEGEIRCTVAEDRVPRCTSQRWDLGRKGKDAASALSPRSTATNTGTKSCVRGVYAEPGCTPVPFNDAVVEAGCYEPCTTLGAACTNGGRCQKAWIDPCVCDPHPNDPDEGCCDACGGEQLLCVKGR